MARVVIITEPGLAPGYQMAGVETLAVKSAGEARQRLEELLSARDVSVIAVHALYLAALDESLQRKIDAQVMPVVISVPAGLTSARGSTRREYISHMLRRAIGFEITFQPLEPPPVGVEVPPP